MLEPDQERNEIASAIVDDGIRVHRHLGNWLLMNFREALLKNGIRRFINPAYDPARPPNLEF